jgi:ketosteroid isomerase-like protein
MSTREVIYKYYEAVNAGNWDMWLALFDENVVIDEQIAGHAEGAAGLRGAINGIKRGYAKFQMHPLHVVTEGDQASVIWHCKAANASGIPIEAYGANYFQVSHDRITYMATYHDTVPFAPFINQRLSV